MFVVVKGRLGVSMRFGDAEEAEEMEVATLTKGAVLGEMSLLLQKPRSATVVVKSRTCVLAEIRYACVKSPSKVPYNTQRHPLTHAHSATARWRRSSKGGRTCIHGWPRLRASGQIPTTTRLHAQRASSQRGSRRR